MAAPIKTFRHHDRKSIQIAVWPGRNGYSCTLKKSYKDKETGEWKDSKYWFFEDIKALGELCHEVEGWLHDDKEDSKTPSEVAQIEAFRDDDIPF